jgi:hypothetical protein
MFIKMSITQKQIHLNINLNIKIFFNKLKYKYKIMCIEMQVNNNMFNTCNNSYFYVIQFFIYNISNQT